MFSMGKLVVMSIICASLYGLPIAHAESMTCEGNGEYIMSDFETPDIAKQRAKVRAEQNAAEQVGVYVKSYTKSVNHVVTDDEVIAIANTIIKIIDEKYKITPIDEKGGGFRVQVNIKVNVDSDTIENCLSRENANLIEQNKQLSTERKRQDVELKNLRRKLLVAESEQKKELLKKEFIKEDKKFLAIQNVDAGNKAYYEKRYIAAIEYYSRAIEFDDYYVTAYYNRGTVYSKQKKYLLAISDFDKAIEIDPLHPCMADVYNNRGYAYAEQGAFERALVDYDKSIKINPDNFAACNNRAVAYLETGNEHSALIIITKLWNYNLPM